MAQISKQYVPPEILALMQLGREGKLWAISIRYSVPGTNETKLMHRRNFTGEKLMTFRESMFRAGFTINIEPGHWKVICPVDIVEVDIFRQTCYMPENVMPVSK